MANKLYEETHIQDIAVAIREKGGTGTYTVQQMGGAIRAIATGSGVPLTSFTNVLNLATTQRVKGQRLTSSKFTATENAENITVYLANAGTYTFRFRGLMPMSQNILRVKTVSIADLTHSGGTETAFWYNGYTDEYGDYCLDITTTISGGYISFCFCTIPNGAIIAINEPIGTGNYTNA